MSSLAPTAFGNRPLGRQAIAWLVTYVAYAALAAAGLHWATISGAASPIWPAAGLAVAAVVLGGPTMATAIALGLVTATQLTGAAHGLASQLMMAGANATAALIAASLLSRIGGDQVARFTTLRSVIALLIAAIVASGISSLVGTASLVATGSLERAIAFPAFETWFFGDAVGILVVGALILSSAMALEDQSPLPWSRLLPVTLAVLLLGYFVFMGPGLARAWAIYPALVWAALALRVQGAAFATLVAALLAVIGTDSGFGPFSLPGGPPDMLLLQQFLAVTATTVLLLAAAIDERNAEADLRAAADRESAARAEAARATSLLTVVGNSTPGLIFAKDREGRYLYANEAVSKVVGLPVGKLLGRRDRDWATPEDTAMLEANDRRIMDGGTTEEIDEIVEGASGRRFWRSIKAPLRDENGTVIGIAGVATDDTERRRQAEDLARRTAELETLLTSAPIGLAYFDREGRFLRVNEELAANNGLPVAQHLGRRIDAVLGRPAPQVLALIRQVFDTGVAVNGVEVPGQTPAMPGRQRFWLTGFFPVRSPGGEMLSVGSWVIEITERKSAEERERLLAREVDHRAKNLLAVVQSVVQLSRAQDPKEFRESVTGRIQSLARAHSLLAAGRWDGVFLADLLGDELAPYTSERPDRVTVDGPPLRLRPAAAQSLALTLHELATNAAKYGALKQPDGFLRVTWTQQQDGVLDLHWVEGGVGPLSPPARSGFGERVTAASIERQLRGSLERTWGDDGLEIRIRVPADQLAEEPVPTLDEAADTAAAAPPPPSTSVEATGTRLMIVEDEALIALEAEQMLTERGFIVTAVAGSVADALAQLDAATPDAALLDINLNGERSFLLAEVLVARGVRVVFCTGYDGDAFVPPHLSHLPLLRKPYRPADVAAALA